MMRRENSDFETEFITSPGDFKENKDYFAYVELDDYVCWVLADSLDSANGIVSAELVVNSILNDFTAEPSLKKRNIKGYIKKANQRLREKNSTISLQSTVLVVVSDYHSLRWGYIGNTRLYHLHKEKIRTKTKDHSLAGMMLEVGDISAQQLNQHQERNNLNRYLGQKKKVKPTVSKKIKLADDDILLFCSSGFWEQINDQDLEKNIGEIKDAGELVEKLELEMLTKTEEGLDNYSLVAVFANKVLQEQVKKKLPLKKITAILIPLLFLSGGVFLYNKRVSKIRAKVMSAKSKFNRANRLIKKGEGKKAEPELQKAKKTYQKLGKDEEVAKIEEQLEIVNAQEIEKKGDQKVTKKEYVSALSDYKEAKLIYLKVGGYKLKEIEAKLFRLTRILKGKDYEREGRESYNTKSYNEAKQKYTLALEIYREFDLKDEVTRLKKRLKKITKKLAQNDQNNKIKEIKAEANEYLQIGEYKSAINKYIEAKVIYDNLGQRQKVAEIDKRIKQINSRSIMQQAEEYEDNGAIQINKQNYTKALFNYKQAEKIYAEHGLSNKSLKIKEKIASVQTAKSLSDAEEKEKLGDQLAAKEKYEKAIMNYKQAKTIYGKVDKLKDFNRIQEKINKVNQKQNGFFKRIFS